MKLVKIFLATAVAMSAALFAVGCSGQVEKGDGYEISNQKLSADGGLITGTIKNTCGELESLAIAYDIFDKDGNKIGVAVGYVDEIANNDQADFEAYLLPETDVDDLRPTILLVRCAKLADSYDENDIAELMENADSFTLRGVGFLKQETKEMEQQTEELKQQN